jgi:hypothetical protein
MFMFVECLAGERCSVGERTSGRKREARKVLAKLWKILG